MTRGKKATWSNEARDLDEINSYLPNGRTKCTWGMGALVYARKGEIVEIMSRPGKVL